MASTYCLDKRELVQLLDLKVNGRALVDAHLLPLVDGAENWQDELSAHTYLLCHILEGWPAHGDCAALLDRFYGLVEEIWLSIQELDERFITYVLNHTRSSDGSTLEEELVRLQRHFREYRYDRTIRY